MLYPILPIGENTDPPEPESSPAFEKLWEERKDLIARLKEIEQELNDMGYAL